MNFDTYILFFFSALGVFNGFLLSFYFLFLAKPRHLSDRFLGFLILMLCVRVGKSLFYYFNDDLAGIYIQIGIGACFLIGPLLYHYIHSVTHSSGLVIRWWKYHLGLLMVVMILVFIRYPYRSYYGIWQMYLMNLLYLQWFIYLILSAWLLWPLYQKTRSQIKLNDSERWILNVFFSNAVIWGVYVSSNYTSYITGAVTFSLVTYLMILRYVFARKKNAIFRLNRGSSNHKDQSQETKIIVAKLDALMREKKLYRNPKLKSNEVAEHLGVSLHEFSRILNQNLGKRYSDIISEYRVSRAKELIETSPQFTIEAIGYESGFNSKSTFYGAFKKHVGETPAQYMRRQKNCK